MYEYLKNVDLLKVNDILTVLYNCNEIYLDFLNPENNGSLNKDKRYFTLIDQVWSYESYDDELFNSIEHKVAKIINDIVKGFCKIEKTEHILDNFKNGKNGIIIKKLYTNRRC